MRKYFIISVFLILFIFNVSSVLSCVRDACILFFDKVFISIFPFMILSDILFYYDYHIFIRDSFIGKFISKLFNIDYISSTIFIFSIFTSQPNNSIYIKSMLDNNEIDIESANKMLAFTYFPSMFFVIGSIGILMFDSFKIGFLLYLNCILNNVLIGLFLRNKKVIIKNNSVIKKSSLLNVIKDSIFKSINNCYIILGNLIIFSILITLIKNTFNLDGLFLGILSSIFEITNALNIIVSLDINMFLKLFLVSFSLNFSGLSILFQSFSILSDYNIDIKKTLILKLMFSLLTSFIFILILFLCPISG